MPWAWNDDFTKPVVLVARLIGASVFISLTISSDVVLLVLSLFFYFRTFWWCSALGWFEKCFGQLNEQDNHLFCIGLSLGFATIIITENNLFVLLIFPSFKVDSSL